LNEKIKISASFPNLITKDSIISLKFICFHLWLLTFKKKICGDLDFFFFLKKIKKNGSYYVFLNFGQISNNFDLLVMNKVWPLQFAKEYDRKSLYPMF